MVDGDFTPNSSPIKMSLSHNFPRAGVGAGERIREILAVGCDCGSLTATLRKRKIGAGVTVHLQCDTCGRSISGALPKREFYDWLHFPWWDDELQESYWARTPPPVGKPIPGPAESASYNEWLAKSPEWRALRMLVYARAGGKCEACLSAKPEHIHHTTYRFGKIPPAWELRAVCSACHKALHDGWRDERDAAE